MRKFGLSQATGRRFAPRVEAPVSAVLSVSAGDYHATIIDISRTGVRLGCEVMLSTGQQVAFRVENIVAAANVIWSDRGSCALEFDTPIAISEVQRLRWRGLESPCG